MKTNIQLLFLSSLLFSNCHQSPKSEALSKDLHSQDSVNVDPLPSWNESRLKTNIITFVKSVTEESSTNFIPVKDRIACFDNDGTLWSEQPLYFQFIYALDKVKEMAPLHPEWKNKEPFKSVLNGDLKNVFAGGEKAMMQLVMATQTGMTTDEFDAAVKSWLITAKHPKTNRPYTDMVYQPMLELLAYLKKNNFKNFIVSGGEEGFMCAWVEKTYGIPSEQVIGTLMTATYHNENDRPYITRNAALDLMNDNVGKPIGIYNQIGKRPVFTVGNSDGDYEMLQWTSTAGAYPRFGMIVHHTDSLREWKYDRHSAIGHLEKALDDADKYHWQIVDMQKEWKIIYPFEKK